MKDRAVLEDLATSTEDVVARREKKSVIDICFDPDASGAALSKASSVACLGCSMDVLDSTMASCDGLKTQRLLLPDCCSDPLEQA